jgi:hypothetical protein
MVPRRLLDSIGVKALGSYLQASASTKRVLGYNPRFNLEKHRNSQKLQVGEANVFSV